MLCRKCGAEIPDDAQRCDYCGTPVADVEKIYDENDQIRQKQIDKNMKEKQDQLSEIQQRRDSKKAKQKRNKAVAIIALCIIAAGAICVGGYYIYNNAKSTKTVVVTPAPESTTLPTHIAVTPAPSADAAEATDAAESEETADWTATGEKGSGTAPDSYTSTGGTSGSSSGGSSSGGTSSSSSGGTSSSSSGSSSGGTSSSANSSSSGASSASSTYSYNSSAKDSGITSSGISSKIAVGGEVITINGNWYMTFTSGDTKYYAKVNEGATTAQVANKVYTITATPTAETYNGNTVYEITSMTKYDGSGYILPNSGTQLLTSADIAGLSKSELALARNEIYARHGREFQNETYRSYFSSKSWYSVNPNYNYDDDSSNLNDIEKQNVAFILEAE